MCLLKSFYINFSQKPVQRHLNKKQFAHALSLKYMIWAFIKYFFNSKNFLTVSKKIDAVFLEKVNKNKTKIRIRGSPK